MKTLMGISILLSTVVLMSATAVSAKPTSIYFYSPDGQWLIDDSEPIFDFSGKQIGSIVHLSGSLLKSGGPGTWATFTCTDTVHFYFDKDGVNKYSMIDRSMVITPVGGTNTLTISGKMKLIVGVPTDFLNPGSWTIVSGTGLYAAVTGGGEMRWIFKFYGTIR